MYVYPAYIDRIVDKIYSILFERVSSELLENFSLELNADKEKVIDKLNVFGFNPKLAESLGEIEKSFTVAKSEFDYKNCMDLVRSFQEALNAALLKKVEEKCNISFEGAITKDVDVRNYFRKKEVNFLAEKEHRFLESVYSFASHFGSHRLTAGKKNMQELAKTS